MSKTLQQLQTFSENRKGYTPREQAEAVLEIFEASQEEALSPEIREAVQRTLQGAFAQGIQKGMESNPYRTAGICTLENAQALYQGNLEDLRGLFAQALETQMESNPCNAANLCISRDTQALYQENLEDLQGMFAQVIEKEMEAAPRSAAEICTWARAQVLYKENIEDLQGMFAQALETQMEADPYHAAFNCIQEGSFNLCQGIEGDSKEKLTTVLEGLGTEHASNVVGFLNKGNSSTARLENLNTLRACVGLEAVTLEGLQQTVNEAGIAQELAVMKGAFSTGAPATADTPQARFEDVGLVM